MNARVVTLGETMALMTSGKLGPLQHNASLSLGIGGAESNVAIGLRRLGVPVRWIGKIGDDSLGDLVERELRAEGLEVVALRDAAAATALMVKERRTASQTRVWYYRERYAGSRLAPADLDLDLIRSAELLHITGISTALSESLRATVFAAIAAAREAGVRVSFDLNFRSRLWSEKEAKKVYSKIVPLCDVVFAGSDEAAIAVGEHDDPHVLAARLLALGAGEAVIKLGAEGAIAATGSASAAHDAVPVTVVDTVGAGDAFVAGYLAETLAGLDLEERLRTAVATGAYACLAAGDWEGLPRRDELEALTATEPVSR